MSWQFVPLADVKQPPNESNQWTFVPLEQTPQTNETKAQTAPIAPIDAEDERLLILQKELRDAYKRLAAGNDPLAQDDIDGIKREIARLPGGGTAPTTQPAAPPVKPELNESNQWAFVPSKKTEDSSTKSDVAEMRAWEPSLWERFKNVLPGDRTTAWAEFTARRIAKEQNISVDEAYKQLKESIGVRGFLGQRPSGQPIWNPEGRAPVGNVIQAAPYLAEAALEIPKSAAVSALRTFRAGDIESPVDQGIIDKTISYLGDEKNNIFIPDIPKFFGLREDDPNYQKLIGLGESLGYSLTTMVASATASAAVSSAGPVTAIGTGMLASGAVAYRASKDDFLNRVRDKLNKNSIEMFGHPISQKEWDAAKKEFNAEAVKYSTWEAVPEAIGNAIMLKAFTAPLKNAKAPMIKRVIERSPQVTTSAIVENAGETATALGQNAAELKAGLTKEEMTVADAFKSQFIQTMLTMGVVGGGAKGLSAAREFYETKVLPKYDPASALAKAIKADIEHLGYTDAAFRSKSSLDTAKERQYTPTLTTPTDRDTEPPQIQTPRLDTTVNTPEVGFKPGDTIPKDYPFVVTGTDGKMYGAGDTIPYVVEITGVGQGPGATEPSISEITTSVADDVSRYLGVPKEEEFASVDAVDQAEPAPDAPKQAEEQEALATPTTSEPAIAPGYVRVYHSGQPTKADEAGRWVSTNKQYASNYRPDLPLYYTDVKETDPRVTSEIPGQNVKNGFTFNFELSPLEVASLKEIKREAPAPQAPPEAALAPTTPPAAPVIQPTEAAKALPETPTVPPVKATKTIEEPAQESVFPGIETTEVPISSLKISKDVPQFKIGASKDGIVEPLGGKFERVGVAPIQVWRRNNGELEIISGRHRFDLAKRSGEKTIPAQIHDESKGFTTDDAAILDAELNIRDGQGKVKDYVNYFQGSGISREEADARGLLARATGKRSYTIAIDGSEELITAVRGDQIGDEAAYYIALNAPNDSKLQSVGIKAIMDGKSGNSAVNLMQAVKALGVENDATTDMFGFDEGAMKEAQAMANIAARKQREMQARLNAITGAAKNPKLAAEEGIDVKDPEAVKQRIDEIKQQKAAWDNWSTNPELIGQIRAERGVAAPTLELRGETEAEIRQREATQDKDRQAAEEKAIADQGRDFFDLQPQTQEREAAPTEDMFGAEGITKQPERKAPEAPPMDTGLFAQEEAEAPKVGQIVKRIPMPDNMEAHVRKTSDGYSASIYDKDADKAVDGSITRYKGEGALEKSTAKAEEFASKAKLPVETPAIKLARKEFEESKGQPAKEIKGAKLVRRKQLIEYESELEAAQRRQKINAENVVNNEKPDADLSADKRLVLMPCSSTKGETKTKAIDLYKGVFYQSFKTNVKPGAQPNVVILSAKHGFISPETEIAPYDQLMTPQRADELKDNLKAEIDKVSWPKNIEDILIVGGRDYQAVMRAALAELINEGKISEFASINATSGGIGEQRQQLNEYLGSIPSKEPLTTAKKKNFYKDLLPSLGFNRLPADSDKSYADKGGWKYVTFERDGVRVAFSSNLLLFKDDKGKKMFGSAEPNESVFGLLEIDSSKRRQGLATKAMQDIVNAADESGTTLYLEPASLDIAKGMTNEALAAFYKKFGFKQVEKNDDSILAREPKDVASSKTPLKITRMTPEEAAELQKTAREQLNNAQTHAKNLGGEVAWQEGDYALIRGYSLFSGDPVYSATNGTRRTGVDVEAFEGTLIPNDIKTKMIGEKIRLEAEEEKIHREQPFIVFDRGISISKDISPELKGVVSEWKDLLKLDVPVYISTIQDAEANRDNFTGPHRRIGSGTLDKNESGSMRRMSDGSYYILFDKSTSPTRMLEVIAHEMGHLHQRLVYENASPTEKDALQQAHRKWLEAQKGKSAQELVNALRGRAVARITKAPEGMSADELSSYWKSFGEWYADQTSRWALSAKAPVTIVEKFFKRLGNQLRLFYQRLKNAKYLPDQTFKEYIERATARPANLELGKDQIDKAEKSQISFDFNDDKKITNEIAKANPVVSKALHEADQLPGANKKLPPGRSPELTAAAQMVKEGRMTASEFDQLVNKYKPIPVYSAPLSPASNEQVFNALDAAKREKINPKISTGYKVGLRLDIPAFNRHGVFVVSIHEKRTGSSPGKVIGYSNVAAAKNVTFGVGNQMAALKIAAGEAKDALQTIEGEYIPITADEAYYKARSVFDSGNWVQVGIDPTRHSYFYDRKTTMPIVKADEVLQIGNMVLAKGVTYGAKESFLYNIGVPSTTARMMEDEIRSAEIKQLNAASRRLTGLMKKVATGEVSLDLQKQVAELSDLSKSLRISIDATRKRKDTPADFLARASKAFADGDINQDVFSVIQAAYQKEPDLLKGLLLSIKAGKGEKAAGQFMHLSRIVRLYKDTKGIEDPQTFRHELTHALEQMMLPEQRKLVVDQYFKDLSKAIEKNTDKRHEEYFQAVMDFLDNPNNRNYEKAAAKLPSYEMYQFINPSEYWAVNAESLMARQLGSAWDRFKMAIRRLFEGLKQVFGFDNQYAVHKVFKEIMNGNKQRISHDILVDYVNSKDVIGARNIIHRQRERSKLGFYSALKDEIDGLNIYSSEPQGWKDAIKGLVNKGKVKASEVEWSGLNDWLDLQEGKVSKNQVTEYLKANGVQVQETVLGGEGKEQAWVVVMPWDTSEPFGSEAEANRWREETIDGYVREEGLDRNKLEELFTIQQVDGELPQGSAKFNQPDLVLPGGENYREVLLTLPERAVGEIPPGYKLIDTAEEDRAGGLNIPTDVIGPWRFEGPSVSSRVFKTREEALVALLQDAKMEEESGVGIPGRYRSSHWEQPNVLAHIRVNDRTDADGKRVLFVEEIQSDWGQEGKKRWFAATKPSARHIELQSMSADKITDEQINELVKLRDKEGVIVEDGEHHPPIAPFVTNTESWLNLALKRVITMAVEGGYDRVAFVNGEQSADRYDLSKQISKIRYADNDSGSDLLWAEMSGKPSRGRLMAWDLSGKEVISESVINPEKELPDLIGKDAAEKLLTSNASNQRTPGGTYARTKELSGLDLKVGGEGMKAFYDKIVPATLNKLLKKLGGRIEEVSIPGGIYKGPLSGETVMNALGIPESQQRKYWADLTQEDRDRLMSEHRMRNIEPKPQLGFDITPEVQEMVGEGVPLFNIEPTRFTALYNIQPDKDLLDKWNRPNTPMLNSKPLATFLLNQWKNGKQMFKDAVNNPKEFAIDQAQNLAEGALYARIKSVWYGAGVEAADYARYGGALRNSENIIIASVALDNAIHSGNIGIEVFSRGGLEYNKNMGRWVAVDRKRGMIGVYKAEKAIKDRLGDQLGTDIIQGYLEAKRSISIMDEFYDREADFEAAKQNLQAMKAAKKPAKDIALAAAEVEELKVELESIKRAVSSVHMSEDEMHEFAKLDARHPELRVLMDNWSAINQNLLKAWRQVGLLSEGRYQRLAAIKDYVPWNRIMDDEDEVRSPLQSTTRTLTNIGREKLFKRGKPLTVVDFIAKEGQQEFHIQPSSVVSVFINDQQVSPSLVSVTQSGDVKISTPIHEGDVVVFQANREIENIIDNMTRNVMRMTMNAIRQHAANRVVREYASRDASGKIMVFPSVDKNKGRFSYIANGKKIIVEISNPLIAEAIYGMENLNLEMMKPLAMAANFVRRTITLSGVFQAKQVFKDAPTAAIVTGVKNPLTLIGGVWKGFITSLTKTDPVIDVLKAAGIGGFHSPARTPEAEIKRRIGILNNNVYHTIIKALDHIGDSSDMAQRVAVYKRVLAETGDQAQAIYQAANVINFMHHGSAGLAQATVKTVPFLGAWANANDVLLNSLVGGGLKGMDRKKALKRLAYTSSVLISLNLLYVMLAGGDPEYDELDDQTKLRNYIIPGTKIMLPANTSAAYFYKAIPEIIYNWITSHGTENEHDRRRVRMALANAARDMLLGPEPVPAGFKPVLEVALDHSFFTGRPVVPEGMKDLEKAEQYIGSTSELAKIISKATSIPFTDEGRVISPVQAEHLVRGIFGTAGAFAGWLSNELGAAGDVRPALEAKDRPFIGPFLRPEIPRGREDLFYDFKDLVTTKHKTWEKMIERGDDAGADAYEDRNGEIPFMHKYVEKLSRKLSKMNTLIREAETSRDPDYTAEERREDINDYKQTKNDILDSIKDIRLDVIGKPWLTEKYEELFK